MGADKERKEAHHDELGVGGQTSVRGDKRGSRKLWWEATVQALLSAGTTQREQQAVGRATHARTLHTLQVRHVGLSNETPWGLMRCIAAGGKRSLPQFKYSLFRPPVPSDPALPARPH